MWEKSFVWRHSKDFPSEFRIWCVNRYIVRIFFLIRFVSICDPKIHVRNCNTWILYGPIFIQFPMSYVACEIVQKESQLDAQYFMQCFECDFLNFCAWSTERYHNQRMKDNLSGTNSIWMRHGKFPCLVKCSIHWVIRHVYLSCKPSHFMHCKLLRFLRKSNLSADARLHVIPDYWCDECLCQFSASHGLCPQ